MLPPYAVPGRAVPPLRPEGAALAAVAAEAAAVVVAVMTAGAVVVAFALLLPPLLTSGTALPLLPPAADVTFAVGVSFGLLLLLLGFVSDLLEVTAAVAAAFAAAFTDAALALALGPALAVAEDTCLCAYAFVASADVRGTFSMSCEWLCMPLLAFAPFPESL